MSVASLFWPDALPAAPGDADLAVVLGVAVLGVLVTSYPDAEAWFARRGHSQAQSVLRGRLRMAMGWALACAVGLAVGPSETGLSWLALPRPMVSLAWLALLLVLWPIVARSARGAAIQARYPEVRARTWTPALARKSLASTALYLLSYEAFFRGFVTFALVELLGVWSGLSVMTALYVLAHLRKDANETVACVPMGYVFGLMTLQSGSIWTAWAIHVVVAWTTEIVAARSNPEMDYPQ